MPRKINCLKIVAFVAVVSSAHLAQAQNDSESGVVSGNGLVVISRKPETMRMLVVLQGKGATLKDALASIKSRGESAKKQLATLGAPKDSIKLDDARIAEPDNNQQQAMQRQRMMMRATGGKIAKPGKKAAKTPDPILVSATLTAEWKLEGKSADDLLMAIHGLQEKIKGTDLAGSKEAEKLTPEQEEALEEMQAEDFGNYNQNEGPKPGEPMFLFVTHIPEADREKAYSQAYQKARTDASRVARAAGMELGELKSLHDMGRNYNNRGYNYNSRSYRVLQMANAATGTAEDEVSEDSTEVVGGDPGSVKYNVAVSASFDLKRPR